jgi:hypothetical protein
MICNPNAFKTMKCVAARKFKSKISNQINPSQAYFFDSDEFWDSLDNRKLLEENTKKKFF